MAQLTLRTGVLGKRLAAHLLRRTTFKINPTAIEAYALKTADEAVDELLQASALLYPDGPLYYGNGEPIFELGRVSQYSGNINQAGRENGTGAFSFSRIIKTYHLWRIYECIHCPTAHWKIMQWFASLFVLDDRAGGGGQFNYHYWRLLYYLAFSDLKQLALKVTNDNNMMSYLDNRDNKVGEPNENYAREFLELFTILKGETIETGNYTNYTEGDIVEASKVLTGFVQDDDYTDPETGICAGRAVIGDHDQSNKTFSAAFQGTTITGATSNADMYRELQDFIDMVFDQMETAKSYVRKMYRFFVSDNISAEIETDIVGPLATTLHGNGYQHIEVLKTLLKSVHFYDEDDEDSGDERIGSKMKTPYELFCGAVSFWEIPNSAVNDLRDHFFLNYEEVGVEHFTRVGMALSGPITVEGFPGYYDAPNYSKNWFSSNILYERFSFGTSFRRGRVRDTDMILPYQVDIVQWVANNLDDPTGPGTPEAPIGASNAAKVVDDTLSYLLPEMPTGDRYTYFEQKLLGGLSPINWYFSWKDYLDTGDPANVKVALERFYDAIMASPEFQVF